MKEEKEFNASEMENLGKSPDKEAEAEFTGSEVTEDIQMEENKETENTSKEETPINDVNQDEVTQEINEEKSELSAEVSTDAQEEEKVEETIEEIPEVSAEVSTDTKEEEKVEETIEEIPEVSAEDSTDTKEEEKVEETVEEIKEEIPEVSAEAKEEERVEETIEKKSSSPTKDPVINNEPETTETVSKTTTDKEKETSKPEEENNDPVDYSTFSKKELVDAILELANADNVMSSFRHVNEMLPRFREIRSEEKEIALKSFIAEGGAEADFDIGHDELTDRFEANLRLIRDRRGKFIKQRENEKDTNYEKKLEVLEKLRGFVDSDETNISFDSFKSIQEEWKAIGAVPQAHNRTLWANYHALIDRFYDNRSIYYELKELDRRKNLETKIDLCSKAEKLADVEALNEAIKELNELHEEFKHVGPVPKEEQEPLWQRFKTASDAVYSRRKAYITDLKKNLDVNLEKKEVICTKAEEYLSFKSDRIKDWNQKTAEILQIQKDWEQIGGIPRAQAKVINKRFWGAFKTFFHNKNTFFKQLDAGREENLEKKRSLVAKAVELKDLQDWNNTAEEFKKLQRQWREVGPVPQKLREKIFAEFKAACDHFFDQKRLNSNSMEAEYTENLKKKEEICEQLEKNAGTDNSSKEQLQVLEKQFNELGFVPRKAIKGIRNRFKHALDKYISKIPGLSDGEKEELILKDEINQIQQSPNAERALIKKQQDLRREIGQLENDIALWRNNLEFFAASKTADKLRDEFEVKINNASDKAVQLKKQLRLLRKV